MRKESYIARIWDLGFTVQSSAKGFFQYLFNACAVLKSVKRGDAKNLLAVEKAVSKGFHLQEQQQLLLLLLSRVLV